MNKKNMKCPICDADFLMTERQGVEIDYCPKCRGIWLDRGELDKLIEKAQSPVVAQPMAMPAQPQSQYPQQSYRNDDHYYDKHKYKKHKGGLLGDIFDF